MKTKNKTKMKTMKNWSRTRFDERTSNVFAKGRKTAIYSIAFVMLSAVFLASCSNDDEELQTGLLTGTWQQVYDTGVVAEGYVQYTFTPGVPFTSGDCTIHAYDVFAGDTTILCNYTITGDNRRLLIFNAQHDGMQEYEIQRISTKSMTWLPVGSDKVLNFKKVK